MNHAKPLNPVERHIAVFGVALLGVAALVFAFGCASGTIDTSAGPRPAATVQAQDAIADFLKIADDTYKAAVAKHDATPVCSATVPQPCDVPELHAKHRTQLLTAARVLRASWGGEIAWKQTGDPTSARLAFCELVKELPDFEALAVGFGLVKQADADRWLPIVSAALNTAGGCP